MRFFQAGLIGMIALAVGSSAAFANQETKAPGDKIKYKSGGDVDFEALLIQGELKRPEMSIITGNAEEGTDGLLRLREDFLDRMAADMGEVAEQGGAL